MRRPPRAALRVAFLDYLAFYRTRWSEGRLSVCNEAAVKALARRFRAPGSGGPAEGFRPFNVYRIAEQCLQMKSEPGGLVFAKLLRAFEFLELLCVNLFLSPWRKEIKSLKTFTGNFVYCMQSVLPNCVVEGLLEKIGYVATTPTEFSLVKKLSEEEAEQAAFEIFLARIECEDLLEIARDVRDSDLGDILQKGAQKHWYPEHEVDGNHQASHREAYLLNREDQAPGYFCPQQTYLTGGRQLAFQKAENTELGGGLSLSEPQPDASFNSEQSSNQSQAGASATSCIKSTDSEDFLTKYSDIVIGQKPLHLTDLPLKASEDKSQATGLIRTMLGPPRNAPRAQTLLSPDASGPKALAILSDAALEGKAAACDYGIQESAEETTESKIRDAMNCLSVCGSYPMDQAKELNGESAIKQSNKLHIVMSLSSEEDPYTSNQLKVKGDSEEELVYPIEETTQGESTIYNRPQEFSPSRVNLTDTPHGDEEDFSIDLYSSDWFTKNACSTTGSKCNRPSVGISSPHQTPGCYRHIGEPPSSASAILPRGAEVQCSGSSPELQDRVNLEGHPLQSSFIDEVTFQACTVKMNETNPEGYVLISKD